MQIFYDVDELFKACGIPSAWVGNLDKAIPTRTEYAAVFTVDEIVRLDHYERALVVGGLAMKGGGNH